MFQFSLNNIYNFIESHEDSQVVMQIIRVAFTSFLPHVSLLSESDVLVNTFLSSILKSLQNLIGNKETVDAAEAEEYLEVSYFFYFIWLSFSLVSIQMLKLFL